MKRRMNTKDTWRNEAGALFVKDLDSHEGYWHICDGIQEKAMPHIWKHDCHAWIELEAEGKTVSTEINYCPICGKKLD